MIAARADATWEMGVPNGAPLLTTCLPWKAPAESRHRLHTAHGEDAIRCMCSRAAFSRIDRVSVMHTAAAMVDLTAGSAHLLRSALLSIPPRVRVASHSRAPRCVPRVVALARAVRWPTNPNQRCSPRGHRQDRGPLVWSHSSRRPTLRLARPGSPWATRCSRLAPHVTCARSRPCWHRTWARPSSSFSSTRPGDTRGNLSSRMLGTRARPSRCSAAKCRISARRTIQPCSPRHGHRAAPRQPRSTAPATHRRVLRQRRSPLPLPPRCNRPSARAAHGVRSCCRHSCSSAWLWPSSAFPPSRPAPQTCFVSPASRIARLVHRQVPRRSSLVGVLMWRLMWCQLTVRPSSPSHHHRLLPSCWRRRPRLQRCRHRSPLAHRPWT